MTVFTFGHSCWISRAASNPSHKQPHNGDDALLYAWDNLQAMTKECHDRKIVLHDGGFGNAVRRTR
jgi:5-methylcytosine-specific restriction protein A